MHGRPVGFDPTHSILTRRRTGTHANTHATLTALASSGIDAVLMNPLSNFDDERPSRRSLPSPWADVVMLLPDRSVCAGVAKLTPEISINSCSCS